MVFEKGLFEGTQPSEYQSKLEWFSEEDPETGFRVTGYWCVFPSPFREEKDVTKEASYEIVRPKLLGEGRNV